jgi:hypothetical protein
VRHAACGASHRESDILEENRRERRPALSGRSGPAGGAWRTAVEVVQRVSDTDLPMGENARRILRGMAEEVNREH